MRDLIEEIKNLWMFKDQSFQSDRLNIKDKYAINEKSYFINSYLKIDTIVIWQCNPWQSLQKGIMNTRSA